MACCCTARFFSGRNHSIARLREMTPEQIARIQMMPVSFTNELYGDEDAKRRARVDARFVNNAMMATLMGAVDFRWPRERTGRQRCRRPI